jgi:hypothetical protein
VVIDAPQQLDAPVVIDAPQQLDAPIVPDIYPPDTVMGQNEAGQYLCNTPTGVVVCACNDGIDNDKDKAIDMADPCCVDPSDNSEAGGTSECSDCIDNDSDGKADAADPDCTGPLDNSEANLGTNISGDNMNCHQDCFFDGDSGPGNDDCYWNLYCDPLEPSQHIISPQPQTKCYPFDASKLGTAECPWQTTTCATDPGGVCNQSQLCLDTCLPITPNGCDCFGCCEVPMAAGGTKTVLLRDTCDTNPDGTIDPLQDDNNDGKLDCPPCTQHPDCLNPCGLCEVCVGKPAPDPSCFQQTDAFVWPYDGSPPDGDAGSATPCAPGVLYCGPGGIDPNMCPPGTYCITGCCIPTDIT